MTVYGTYIPSVPKRLTAAFIPLILIIDIYCKLQSYIIKKGEEFYEIDINFQGTRFAKIQNIDFYLSQIQKTFQ